MNRLINKSDFEELANIYMVSNTPMFLFNQFKNYPCIRNISEINYDKVINAYNNIINKKNKDFEDILSLYAVLVSFVYRDTKDITNKLKKLDFSSIKWGDIIKEFVLTELKIIPTHYYKISQKPLISKNINRSKNSSTFKSIKLN